MFVLAVFLFVKWKTAYEVRISGWSSDVCSSDLTLKEVKRCTQKDIVINTFMLDRNYYLKEFVNQIAKMNKGRVFYTTPERLGQYILVDYVAQKDRTSVG